MSQSSLRLRLRDLGAAAAFGSMAVSGDLPLPLTVLFFVGLSFAVWGRRVLEKGGALPVALLALGALGLYASVALGELDLVVAACSFAGLLTVHRMLSAPTPTVDGQVMLISLLMLAGGAALTAELTYALCLTAFALCTLVALGLGVVESSLAEGEAVPRRPLVRLLLIGGACALLGGAGFFILFPRLSWNVASQRMGRGLSPTTGFSREVRLSGTGTLKSSPRTVLRARLSPDPGRDTLESYWIAVTHESFDGRTWRSSAVPAIRRAELTRGPLRPGLVRQEIELLPAFGARTAVALERPWSFQRGSVASAQGARPTAFEVIPGSEVQLMGEGNGYRYVALSFPPSQALEEQAPSLLERDAQTSLPDSLDPRVPALAAQVLGPERDPRRAAEKLERYLQTNYRYTLELPGEVSNPLAHFLFERRAGHCEHFATALTLLLRTAGIRARLVSGFFGGKRVDDVYVLRAGDAHAWTEAYIPGEGWVRFDATPPAFRSAQPAPLWATLTAALERLDALWRDRVLDFSMRDQASLVMRVIPPQKKRSLPSLPWKVLALCALAGIAAYALVRVFTGADAAAHPATRLREELESLMLRAGLMERDEPLESLTARLRAVGHPAAPALSLATRRYLESRFGEVLPPDRTEQRALVKAVQTALIAPAPHVHPPQEATRR